MQVGGHSPHPGLDFCRPLSALPQTVPIERGRGGEGVKGEVGEGDGILKPAPKSLINSLNKCALKADYVPDVVLIQWEGCHGGGPPSDNVLPIYSCPCWPKVKMASSEM